MGYLTNVSISNDFWHEISKDPKRMVDEITRSMTSGNSGIDSDRPGIQGLVVHKAEHYDTPQVIVNSYGSDPINTFWLTQEWVNENLVHARRILGVLEATAKHIRSRLDAAPEA